MITLYPIPDPRYVDDASEASNALVQKVVTTIRMLRTEKNVPSMERPRVILNVADDYKKTILDGYRHLVLEQAKLGDLLVRRTGEAPSGPWSLVWPATWKCSRAGGPGRLRRRTCQARQGARQVGQGSGSPGKKLANPQFLERAPAAVLEKDRARLAEIESALTRLDAALARLG